MRIAISNIAWDVGDDEGVAELLNHYGIDAIDTAPGKYFDNLPQTTDRDIERVSTWWANRGISITGMQALLFGTTGLNLFGDPTSRDQMLTHLEAVCRIGSGLGAPRLVFGSPKNRDCSGLTSSQTDTLALEFFQRLGDIAGNHGVTICLEPNPPCYGANFMTNSAETAALVNQVAHPSIRMQLDTGAMTINQESPADVVPTYAPIIGHIHASEPGLVPLGEGGCDHSAMGQIINTNLPDQVVSIEMLTTNGKTNLAAIEQALKVAIRYYQNDLTIEEIHA